MVPAQAPESSASSAIVSVEVEVPNVVVELDIGEAEEDPPAVDLLKLLAKAIGATVSGPKKDLAKRIRREAEGVPPGPPLADNLQSLSVGDLKTLLRNRRLPVKGRMLLPRGA